MRPSEAALLDLWSELPLGRHDPIPGRVLAARLGISERMVRALVEELIDRGSLVGSVLGDRPGYFRIDDLEDLRVGTSHLISRARALHVRIGRLRRSAQRQFVDQAEQQVLSLFELDPTNQVAYATEEKEAPG
jgi:biotin operon repressor